MTAPSPAPPRSSKAVRANRTVSSREPERSLLDDQPEPSTENKPLVYKPGVLVRPLTDLYETIGGMVCLADQVCGTAIIQSAPEAAKSLDELARVNPKVRKALIKMVSGGVTGKVVIAHLPIFMAVMAHHFPKALPALLGVMNRDRDKTDE